MEIFTVSFIALYVAHHVGDYWIQTHEQAMQKGDAGLGGALACLAHVSTYIGTQFICLVLAELATGVRVGSWPLALALAISAATHYTADRREHGLLFWLARRMPWKAGFLALGQPRAGANDNPQLATGAWALDQSWHILFGCFVPALVLAL